MSEERLQEIKDSINLQYELIVSKGIDKSALLFTDEEQELLEEVERLQNIIKEAKEFIYENAYDEERKICIDDLWGEIPKLLDILKGSE